MSEIGSATFGLVVGLGRFKKQLAEAEDEASQSGERIGENIGAAADNAIERAGAGWSDKLSSWGSGLDNLGGKLTKNLTPAAAAFGGASAVAFRDWKAGVDELVAGTGASGEALDDLTDSMRTVGGQVRSDLGEVAAALANVNTHTAATGPVLEDMTRQVLRASEALGENGAQNADTFGRAMQQWQIPAEDGAELLDVLANASQTYGVGLGELSGTLNTYGSVMKNAGFSVEETAELMARMHQQGISWSRISPGLNKSFRDWAAAGKDPREELTRVIAEMQGVETEAEALTIATNTFGAEGAQRLVAGVRNGAFALDDLGVALADSAGTIDDMHSRTGSLSDRLKMMKNRVVAAVGPYAEMGMVIGGAAAGLGPMMQGAGKVIGGMPRVASAVGNAATSFAGLGRKALTAGANVARAGAMMAAQAARATASAIGSLIAQGVQWVVLGVKALAAGAQVALAWLISMGPILLVAAAVVGLVYLIVRNFDTIKEAIGKAWNWVKDRAGAAWDWITDKVSGVIDFFRRLPERIRRAVSGMWDGIKEAFRSAVNWIIRAWNRLEFTVPAVSLPGVGKVGGWTIGTPKIPELAQGGRVISPGLALVGEAGPELLELPVGAEVTPLDRVGAPVMQAGPATEVIQLVLDGRVVSEVVRDRWSAISRRGGRVFAGAR